MYLIQYGNSYERCYGAISLSTVSEIFSNPEMGCRLCIKTSLIILLSVLHIKAKVFKGVMILGVSTLGCPTWHILKDYLRVGAEHYQKSCSFMVSICGHPKSLVTLENPIPCLFTSAKHLAHFWCYINNNNITINHEDEKRTQERSLRPVEIFIGLMANLAQ